MDPDCSIASKRKLIIGIGNPLMEDDGIGVRLAEILADDPELEEFAIAAGETDLDYCLSLIADAGCCILLDAAWLGDTPFTVRTQELGQVLKTPGSAHTFHDFDLIQAMRRYRMVKEGCMITVEVSSVSLSPGLSPAMQERLDEIVRSVKQKILPYR